MSAFDDGGLDDRLDRACESADRAPPEEALATLRAVRAELDAAADRLGASDAAADDLARCLAAEATAHARAGRPADALQAFADAIGHHRRAAELDPLGAPRTRQIAELRARRTACLRDLDRLGEALEEAVAAATELEAIAPPGTTDPDLRAVESAADARSAAFLAASALGRSDAAARNCLAAIAHRRRVAEGAEPASDAQGQLFGAIMDMAWEHEHAGRHAEGLAAAAEARRIAEAAVAADPFANRWQRSLAGSRATAAECLRSLGRLDDAERELRAALFIAETLASLDPADNLLRVDLVRRWQDLSDLHLARGDVPALLDAARRRADAASRLDPPDPVAESAARAALAHAHLEAEDAPAALREAEAGLAALAKVRSPGADTLVHAGIAHDYAARATRESGDAQAATQRWETSLATLRRAAAAAPGREWIATTLWRVLRVASSHLRDIGRDTAALPLLEEALRLRADGAAGADAGPRILDEIAETANALASVLEALGRDADAVAPAREGLLARERIDAASAAAGARDLASAQSAAWERRRLGYLLWRTGDSAAEAEFRRASAESEGGLAEAPGDADWTAVAAATADSLGDFLADRGGPGDAAESLRLAEREAELALRRADAAPESAMSLRAAGVALRDLGVARRGAGDADGALAALSRAIDLLTATRRLAPADDVARLWLSYATFDRGGVREQRRELPEALADFVLSRDIDAERLRDAPEDRSRLFALAASLQAIHGIAKDAGSPELEEPSAREELALRRRLAEGGSETDSHNLRWALHRLARTLCDAGRGDEARAAAAESREASQRYADEHPGDLHAQGLLANTLETAADAADRTDPAQRETAAAQYRAVLAIFAGHEPEELGHRADCTCVADATRKLGELGAAPPEPGAA